MRKAILRQILVEVDEQINKLNIRYISQDLINNVEYERTIEELYKIKHLILDYLCQ